MKKKELTIEDWKEIFEEINREVVAPATSFRDMAERLMEFGKEKCGLLNEPYEVERKLL